MYDDVYYGSESGRQFHVRWIDVEFNLRWEFSEGPNIDAIISIDICDKHYGYYRSFGIVEL